MSSRKIISCNMHAHVDALINQAIDPGYKKPEFYIETIDEEKLPALSEGGIDTHCPTFSYLKWIC